MADLTIPFDELPLFGTDTDVNGTVWEWPCYAAGTAYVSVARNGGWHVTDIALDCYDRKARESRSRYVDKSRPLYGVLKAILEGPVGSQIIEGEIQQHWNDYGRAA